jgi:hypothetical protein
MTPETVARATSDDDLVDVAEAARLLGLHVNTTKRLDPADLPYFRVGTRGDRRYRLGDVRAYLAARRVG